MSTPASSPAPPPGPDLSRLRIDRDAPPPALRRALLRNFALVAAALALLAAGAVYLRRGGAVPVQVVVATATTGGARGAAGATSVTANGYVVARTRAAVAAKLPGRLAELRVSEGSYVRRGEVIARLENTDYQAQVHQAEASLTSDRAAQAESEADRDELVREARRAADIRSRSPELISQQEAEAAQSRAAQGEARVRAAAARVGAAEAALSYAQANLEFTVI